MNEWVVGAIMGVTGTALVWCGWFYIETIKGLWRWHDQRLERMIRDRLRGKQNFLVPKEG